MDELLTRAITAFYRTRPAQDARQPGQASERLICNGKAYVVLREDASAELLAVYRCMNRGELKRLKRWPDELAHRPGDLSESARPPAAEAMPVLLELVPVPRKEPAKAAGPGDQAGLF